MTFDDDRSADFDWLSEYEHLCEERDKLGVRIFSLEKELTEIRGLFMAKQDEIKAMENMEDKGSL